tara:strand:+ start:860 stop:1441 length:582 start_codon:yes stop_codon:yes gene_type:complete
MAFKVNGTTIVNDSRQVSNIIASTAEAQAGTNNNKVMTPQRTKEMIQGGTVSVIKSFQRIDYRTGTFVSGNFTYQSLGASPGLVSGSGGADPSGISFSTPGAAGTYNFFTGFTKDRYKTMLLMDHGGSGGQAALTNNAGVPKFDNFSVCGRFTNSAGSNTNSSIQIAHSDYFAYNSSYTFGTIGIRIQMVEFY